MADKQGKIRILEIIQTEGIGGAEMVMLNIMQHIDKDKFDCRALVVGKGGKLLDKLDEYGYAYNRHEILTRYSASFLKKIRALIKEQRIDIVHTHLSRMNMYGFLSSIMTSAKNVMTIHGTSEVRGLPARLYYSLCGNLSGRVVTVSDGLARVFSARTGVRKSNIKVIPNGIDVRRFGSSVDREAVRLRHGLPVGSQVILSVGNIRPIKGFDLLIDAFAMLAKKYPDAVVVICGHDVNNYRPGLEKRIFDNGLSQRVFLPDFVDEIDKIYAASDIFVLPSVSEGFSLTTVEAMASGLPVIATDCLGPREIIEDGVNGLILKAREPKLMADAIAGLLDNAERRRELGRAAKVRVSKRFNIAITVREFENLFSGLSRKDN